MKEIYFIRHGETDNNKLGKAQGGGVDSELNKTGVEQATYTGKYLKEYRIKDKNFDAIYVSPLKRAKKTAEIICNQIGYDKNNIIFDDNLREKHEGELGDNITWDEKAKHPKFKSYVEMINGMLKEKDPIKLNMQFASNDYYKLIKKKFGGKNYETREDVFKRILKFLNTIKKSKHNKILIVAHNGVILDTIELLFNIGFFASRHMEDVKYGTNCHITYIHYDKNKFQLIMPPNTLHFGIYGKDYSK